MDKVLKITFPDESLSISKFQSGNNFVSFLLVGFVLKRLEPLPGQLKHVVKEHGKVPHFITLTKVHALGVIPLNQAVADFLKAVERAGKLVGKENGEQRYLHDNEENADTEHP